MAENLTIPTSPTAGSLDRSIARAVAWNAVARWIGQIMSWASTILVARMLMPSDYGLIGMAGLYLNLAMLTTQVGIANTILVFQDLSEGVIAQLNALSLCVGAAMVGLSCLAAYPLARFFAAPPVFTIVAVSSVWYIFASFQVVPRGLLQRELRFPLLAGIETARVSFQSVITVLSAWLGLRYWSLVIGYLGGTAFASVLILIWKRHAFALPRFHELKREIKYSVQVLLSFMASYAYDNADFMVAGRVLGEVPLGNYTVAWTISSAPVEKISNLVTGVTPAYFSAMQENKQELRRYLLRITEMLSYVTIPASLGLALSADVLVNVLFGPTWNGVIGPLRLLGIFVAFRSITTILPNLLTAIGKASFVMKATVVAATLMPIAFYLGSHWGVVGIAAAWIFAYPIITAPLFYKAARVTDLHCREYLFALFPALNSSLVMAVAVLAVRRLLLRQSDSVSGLVAMIWVAICAYLAALLIFHRGRTMHMLTTAKAIFRKDKHVQQA